jgi:hypothetical protein
MAWDSGLLKELWEYITPQSLIGLNKKGKKLPDSIAPENIPDVGELDELETFVGSKKTRFGCGQQ